MADWRYYATRLHGDGTETLLADDLPLQGPAFTTDLSGPSAFSASIAPEVSRLKGEDGLPLLRKWNTAIYAETGGHIHGAGIVTDLAADSEELAFDAVGWAGYPAGQPWVGPGLAEVQADPLDMVRAVWDHLQAHGGGNLGLQVDREATSPVRIGEEERDVEFETGDGDAVAFEAGPFRLSEWSTTDLGKVLDDLATESPFDWRERHVRVGDEILHYLDLGYPALGRRRHDLRFVEGENVFAIPEVGFGAEEYATAALVLGSGEGRDMARGTWTRPDATGVRRVAVVEAKDVASDSRATSIARREAEARTDAPRINGDFLVGNHPHAPLGAYRVGDEIRVQTSSGWAPEFTTWVRIVSLTIDPGADMTTIKTTPVGV